MARLAQATIIVDAAYPMGEADSGAANGVPGNATTNDTVVSGLGGGGPLTQTAAGTPAGSTITYSSTTPSPASSLSTNFTYDSTGNNGYYYSNLNPIPYTTNFGISTWVNASSFVNNRSGLDISTIVYDGNSGGYPSGSGMGILLYNNGSNFVFASLVGGISGLPFTPQSGPVSLNTWYQVAVVDTSNGGGADTQTMYINGTAVGSVTAYNPGTAYSTMPSNYSGIYIGADNSSSGDGFNGLIDYTSFFHFSQGGFSPGDLAALVPEPSSYVMACLGMIGLAWAAVRRRK